MEKTVAFYTLGCRVNQYESAAMEALFRSAGYKVVDFADAAGVYVINTCAVTAESERKCRQILRRAKAKNPAAVVAAVGCMVQASKTILEKIPEVDVLVGVSQKQNIVAAVEDAAAHPSLIDDVSRLSVYTEMKVPDFASRDRAFVKIQDGCDRFCSYCIIPYVRGRVRSRTPENILNEIRTLSEKGFSEVVLTGIHVASFGRGSETDISDLIRMVSKIDGIARIRLSSIDPTAFTPKLLDTYAAVDKLCPHFHISLQSGSASVLKRMNRRYTPEAYSETVDTLRAIRPDTAITTDIITGFPGETDAEFAETVAFAEAVALSGIHVFPYSVRTGTKAASLPNQLPKKIKEDRARLLIQKAALLRSSYIKRFVGTVQHVLLEESTAGFTPHFVRVKLDNAEENATLSGKIVPVEIYKSEGDLLYGKRYR